MNLFTEKITDILDVMAPVRTIQIRKKHNSWISEDCKQMMKRRDILQRQAAQTNNPNTWRAYKDIRNKINNILRYEERVWKQKRLSEVRVTQVNPGR